MEFEMSRLREKHEQPRRFLRRLVAVAFLSVSLTVVSAAELTVAEQKTLIAERCAVCHSDLTRLGGMSLARYDAAVAPPSLAAMLLSQLTDGLSLTTYRSEAPESVALVDERLAGGAINAAGPGKPSKEVVDALVASLLEQAEGAFDWSASESSHMSHSGLIGEQFFSARQLREVQVGESPDDATFYQLTLTCEEATGEGEMQLAWSPVRQTGHPIRITFDGRESSVVLDGEDSAMGPSGLATRTSVTLSKPGSDTRATDFRGLPLDLLNVRDVVPGQSVTFSFDALPDPTRTRLLACFPE